MIFRVVYGQTTPWRQRRGSFRIFSGLTVISRGMVSVGLGVVPLFFARCGAAYQAGEALSSVERAIKTAKSYFAEPTNTRGKIYRVVHRRKAACCYGSTNHIAPTATGA